MADPDGSLIPAGLRGLDDHRPELAAMIVLVVLNPNVPGSGCLGRGKGLRGDRRRYVQGHVRQRSPLLAIGVDLRMAAEKV